MHEGDHSILDHDHDHAHPHPQAPATARRPSGSRMLAGLIVAAAVVAFLVWRFL
ncbi:MAG: hypothetical protein QN174_05665 [Armatimonadota bacterium]|nr:hypothetical protein [Armatimonadota bacterium]MDR7421288.1 hypothetical protein [Armatimonadota bacterium]MDR7454079.1 hypothetical protein [Armatimonadota bacterium]MDR7455789.1 hypothetical protein [Armatimonadota bacterium]MDR7496427.1 hypothetical protein [Armatimonadota bacterium]